MGKTCSWGTCNSDTRYPERLTGGVTFFPFPKWRRSLPNNREKCMRWIKACNRPHYQLNLKKVENSYCRYVCSKHFVDGKPTKENPYPVFASDNESSTSAPPTKLRASGSRMVLRGARKPPKVATKDRSKGGRCKGKQAAVQPVSKKKRTQRKVLASGEDDFDTQWCSQDSSNDVEESSSEKQHFVDGKPTKENPYPVFAADNQPSTSAPPTKLRASGSRMVLSDARKPPKVATEVETGPVILNSQTADESKGSSCKGKQAAVQPDSTKKGTQRKVLASCEVDSNTQWCSQGTSNDVEESSSEKQDSKMIWFVPVTQLVPVPVYVPLVSPMQGSGQNCWQPVLQSSGPATSQSLGPQPCLPACAPFPVMSQVQGSGQNCWQPVLQNSVPATSQSLGPQPCLPACAPFPVVQGSGQNCWQPVLQNSVPATSQSLGPQLCLPASAPVPVMSPVQGSGQNCWQPVLQSSVPAYPFPVMSPVQGSGQNCRQPVLQSSGPATSQSLRPQLCLPASAPVPVMSPVQGSGQNCWQPVLQSSGPATSQSLGPQPCLPAHAPVPVMLIGPQEKELLSQMCSSRVESSVEETRWSSIQEDFSEELAVTPVVKEEPFEGDSSAQSYSEQGISHTTQEHAALPLAEVKIEPAENGISIHCFQEHEVTQASQGCATVPTEVNMEADFAASFVEERRVHQAQEQSAKFPVQVKMEPIEDYSN